MARAGSAQEEARLDAVSQEAGSARGAAESALAGSGLDGADLRGADLRGARLSTNIRDCYSFCDAKFTSDALPWLILHPKWSELKGTVQIEPVSE